MLDQDVGVDVDVAGVQAHARTRKKKNPDAISRVGAFNR